MDTATIAVTASRVSATETVVFPLDQQPVVTDRSGTILHGSSFALAQLTVTAHAVTQTDNTVRVFLELAPKAARLARSNGDPITHADWRFLSITEAQAAGIPAAAAAVEAVTRAVHMLHPLLSLTDAA